MPSKFQATKIIYSTVAAATAIAMAVFVVSSMQGNAVPSKEVPKNAWVMRSFSPDGYYPISVRNDEFKLYLNQTDIQGGICNGFGGDIEYTDPSVIKGRFVFVTAMLCLGPTGTLAMEVEDAFLDGLNNGMAVSENDGVLVLNDVVTNATFVYERARSV